MELILVRHGVSELNHGDVVSGGSSNPDLTNQGVSNIKKISQHLDLDKVDIVYASPLKRAYKTAQLLVPGKSICRDDRLKEMDFGAWDGLHATELAQDFPDSFDYMGLFSNEYAKHAQGAESYDDVVKRTSEFLNDVKSANSQKTVMVVCHGVTIRGLMAAIFKLDTAEIMNVKNVAFNEIIFDEDHDWEPRLISFNRKLPILIAK